MKFPERILSTEESCIKVVICDDHGIYRQGVKHVLRDKKDVEVIGEAEDGLQLMKLLKHVEPDIVLLDINMPVMDGTVALPRIKKEYPDIKILILSMQNTPEMIKIMMGLGADGYLSKNDNEELIYKAVKDCHNNGRYIDKRTEDVLVQNIRSGGSISTMIVNPESSSISLHPIFPAETEVLEKEPGFWVKYKWALRAVLTGLAVGAVAILIVYIYYRASSFDPIEKAYTPPTNEISR
jgi:DNA-binding NarL/FixJ family response regulator